MISWIIVLAGMDLVAVVDAGLSDGSIMYEAATGLITKRAPETSLCEPSGQEGSGSLPGDSRFQRAARFVAACLVCRPIDGFEGATLTPNDFLNGPALQGTVVIYDDNHYYIANVLAAELAARGHEVNIATPMPTLAPWMVQTLEQPRMIGKLMSHGIRIYPNSTATAWANGALSVIRSDTGEPLPAIHGATLLSGTARMPDPSLSNALAERNISHRVIGDGDAPGTIQSAVFSGHRNARELLGQIPASGSFKRERPILFA